MNAITDILKYIMSVCYRVCGNYGLAVVLFTFITRIILLPFTLWTYFNSVKMVKIQPEINHIRAKYYGQGDIISEQEARIYKEQGYHPLLSVLPLILQLILLIGVVAVIRDGINDPTLDMRFGPFNLGDVAAEKGIRFAYVPLLAGLSSLLLSITQNRDNILQSEQSAWNKYGTMIFSVALSLYLGWLVPVGTAWYWVLSNLMAIAQMYLLNAVIKPERYVDYEKLEESRKELAALKNVGSKKRESLFSENRRRERADYKRFFSVVNKHLVFYSESSGFYKYYKGFIEYILTHTNLIVHYITSDPNDQIFSIARENERIRAYYIGENRLITLMMKMDADIVAMTMPDLEQYHIKRSYVRKDIEYLYIQHGIGSVNMLLRKGALDYYDTIFVCNGVQRDEIRDTERVYNLKEKRIVEVGYPLIDEMRAAYRETEGSSRKTVLIAPSWQPDNIVDSCLETILNALEERPYRIIVRPHPQEVRLKYDYIMSLAKQYQSGDNNTNRAVIEFQTDFSSDRTVMDSDLLITDWSDISFEYAFTTHRPVLFINTPMKEMNPDWRDLSVEPLNLTARNVIGTSLNVEDLKELMADTVDALLNEQEIYRSKIAAAVAEWLYNRGNSAEVGADYMINSLKHKIMQKKEEKSK